MKKKLCLAFLLLGLPSCIHLHPSVASNRHRIEAIEWRLDAIDAKNPVELRGLKR